MYDVITVGSGTIDVFAWTDARIVDIKTAEGKEKLTCYPLGSKILINKLAISTGGGGTNSAVSLSRLGLKVAWLGKVGNDEHGRIILRQIKDEKIGFLGKVDKNDISGYSVVLDSMFEKDRTILTYKGANDELKFSEIDTKKLKTKWFYFCAMEGESFATLERLAEYAKKRNIKVLFNPSAYLAKQGIEFLNKIINATGILVLNKEEAQYLIGRLEIDSLLERLQQHVPIVVITDGERGAFAYNGIKKYSIFPKKIDVAETTGAGDAFASGFLAGIVLKGEIEFALQLGQVNAESVIQHIGAKEKLLKLKEALKIIGKKGHYNLKIEKIK